MECTPVAGAGADASAAGAAIAAAALLSDPGDP